MALIAKSNHNKFFMRAVYFLMALLLPMQMSAQFERFKTFDVVDGICHGFVYNINQDKDGFIWLGTGEGLCRFDGYEFESFSNVDSLSNNVVSVSFKDSLGNLWFGFNNSLVLNWDGSHFNKIKLPIEGTSKITSIKQTPSGEVFIATQNKGCFVVTADGQVNKAAVELKGKFISCTGFSKNHFLLGTTDGLEIMPFRGNDFDETKIAQVKELEFVSINNIKNAGSSNQFFIGTEDEGLFLLKLESETYTIAKVGEGTEFANVIVEDVILTRDNDLWVCTRRSGVVKLSEFSNDGTYSALSVYKKENNFPTNYTKSVFSDREGNLWIGTYSNGIALLTEQAFSFISYEDYIANNNILSVASNTSKLWVGGENGLLEVNLDNKKIEKIYNSTNGLPKDKITTLFLKENTLWIGTGTSGIYKLDVKTNQLSQFFTTGNTLGKSINYLMADDHSLYAATKDGIYNFDLLTNKKYQYNTSVGLPYNDIEHIFINKENRLLFATKSNGIYEINDKGEVEDYFTVGQYELAFNSIAQDVNEHVWVSTFGQGIFLLMQDSVINFTTQEKLKSDYCYSIVTADSNYIWVGHRLGISRININDYTVKTFDLDIGIQGDCNLNAVAVNDNGKIFFGTTDGVILYDIKKGAKKSVAPKPNVMKLLVMGDEYNYDKPIVLPYSAYKIRVEFIGLNYKEPDAVRYQYKLEGYDLDWSDITEQKYATYSRIEDGEYTFLLKTFGENKEAEEESVGFTIKVKLPIWKKWWFILLMSLVVVSVVILIIKYRERRQKEIQEYLEKSLDERTREVVEQKEEIEVKNRDITDSINYAQRIQTSILPPIKKLQQSFSGSFIFYKPRDIVSGDFYWFDKVADNRFVIICADSTGHGVPGAFMSMIGTTLIKDICNSQSANSPGEILTALDEQLRSTLHQHTDDSKSNDGMDIMVCEIDINNNYLRYSSAMRPMIVYKNGEQIYIKGSRSSIGGQYDAKDEKKFATEELQLNKGDLVYMFSDGYPDQFGGSLGKKFKMVRLKTLIKDIHKKPMEEQYEYVKSTFNLWREDYEQVDDVLFMGIKL